MRTAVTASTVQSKKEKQMATDNDGNNDNPRQLVSVFITVEAKGEINKQNKGEAKEEWLYFLTANKEFIMFIYAHKFHEPDS